MRLLESELLKNGYVSKIIPIKHVKELENKIEGLYEQSLISENIYNKELKICLDFDIEKQFPEAQSVLLIACSSPQVKVTFNINQKKVTFKVPPYYGDWQNTVESVKNIIKPILKKHNYKYTQAQLPEKLLAVCSGLGHYGRNNLCYINGMGSYLCFASFLTDIQVDGDSWADMGRLERCENCDLCVQNCPSGAINKESFLINAERCLTFYNEGKGIFPKWIQSNWHNCLIGCLSCQEICPENKSYREKNIKKVEFTEIETSYILENHPAESLPEDLEKKLIKLGLRGYYNYNRLSRNIFALLKKDKINIG